MIDKTAFLKPRLPETDVELPGFTVRIRGLSRGEVMTCRSREPSELERAVLSIAFLDPDLSEDEAEAWLQAVPAHEVRTVLDAIWELSGLREGQAKAVYKSVPGES